MITEISNDRGKQLALIYQAIAEVEQDKKEAMKEYAETLERLHGSANKLRFEILTGQQTIPLEPPPEPEKKAEAA